MTTFGRRLQDAVADRGRLCVGIDPHPGLLEDWALPTDADGAREFGLRTVDACAGRVAVVKPQVALFERFGAAGFASLEVVLAAARAAGLIVIADAKRGDIGSTMFGYASAWITPGSPLEADALTVSPYLGVASLAETAHAAIDNGKGLFVLAATSNPEARWQRLPLGPEGPTLAADVCDGVRGLWTDASAPAVGVVIGATLDRAVYGLDDELLRDMPILAPGFGHQGAKLEELPRLFGALAGQVLASASRSILSAGPDGLVSAIESHQDRLEA